MSIAQKLTALRENMPKVFDAGKQWVFNYISDCGGMFYKTQFPDGCTLDIAMPQVESNIQGMFRTSSGLQQLRLRLSGEKVYNGMYFAYFCTSLKLLTLPEGIRFSNFSNFANRCSSLEQVIGAVDLSQSVLNESCFNSCPELREVRFVPGSIYLSLHFRNSEKLSPETVESLLAGLADVNDRETQSLMLHETVKTQLTPEQLATLEAKNWQLT